MERILEGKLTGEDVCVAEEAYNNLHSEEVCKYSRDCSDCSRVKKLP